MRKATPQPNAEKKFHCSFEIFKLLTLVGAVRIGKALSESLSVICVRRWQDDGSMGNAVTIIDLVLIMESIGYPRVNLSSNRVCVGEGRRVLFSCPDIVRSRRASILLKVPCV